MNSMQFIANLSSELVPCFVTQLCSYSEASGLKQVFIGQGMVIAVIAQLLAQSSKLELLLQSTKTEIERLDCLQENDHDADRFMTEPGASAMLSLKEHCFEILTSGYPQAFVGGLICLLESGVVRKVVT